MQEDPTRGPGALDGVRIIDLTTVVMGPLATRMLADHGADVIRVEGPHPAYDLGRDPTERSAIALDTHRNKRSITLDLKTDVGMAAMNDLVAGADVFVTNMRAAALDRLGLGAEELRSIHPGLIHCVANGFGPDGPYADRAAYDDAIQAASGLAALYGHAGRDPAYVPSIIADKTCALYVAQAVLLALLHKRSTGEGQTIMVPMFETMVSYNMIEHLRGAAYDPPRGSVGYGRILTPHRRPYRCRDGWIGLLPYSDQNYRDFFTMIGRPDLIEDERFTTHGGRIANVDVLYGMIADAAPDYTVAEWMEMCDQHSIPASPVVDLSDIPDDPHVRDVDLIQNVDHPILGGYRTVRDPVSYDTLDSSLRHHAPIPGQHTAEILAELGWSDERIGQATEAT